MHMTCMVCPAALPVRMSVRAARMITEKTMATTMAVTAPSSAPPQLQQSSPSSPRDGRPRNLPRIRGTTPISAPISKPAKNPSMIHSILFPSKVFLFCGLSYHTAPGLRPSDFRRSSKISRTGKIMGEKMKYENFCGQRQNYCKFACFAGIMQPKEANDPAVEEPVWIKLIFGFCNV